MRLDRPAQYLVVGGQRDPHLVRVCLPPTGRTLHIGEQKRHHPRRSSTRHGIASAHAICPSKPSFSPCRGSDPGSPGRRLRLRGLGPAAPASATARCRVSPDPHRLARPPTARSRPRLRLRHRRPAVEQCLHQNTRRWNAPQQQSSCAEQMVDGGAHERYRVIAVSTSSPFTCQVDLDDRQIA